MPLLSSLGKSQKRQLAKELIIVDGKVDVKSSKAGHLAYLSEGDYACEQATLTAVETTTCLLCSKSTFDKIKKSVKFAKMRSSTTEKARSGGRSRPT